jgi:hypothetical protein
MAYVAYTEMGPGCPPGTAVEEDSFEPELWQYYLDHGVVVRQGGEHDPNVLAARAAGEGYEDPRDQRIADLEAELARLRGTDTSDTSDDSSEEGGKSSEGKTGESETGEGATTKPAPVAPAKPADAPKS